VTWRTGEETATDVGRLCAVSRRLHEVLGISSLVARGPALVVALDELSLQHAWHAELLFEQLPLRAGYDREAAVQLGGVASPLDLLASLGAAGDDVGLLAGYARVILPRVTLSLEVVSQSTTEVAERSLRRATRLICSDLAAAEPLVEQLAEGMIAASGAAEHAVFVVGDLEGVLGARTGVLGD